MKSSHIPWKFAKTIPNVSSRYKGQIQRKCSQYICFVVCSYQSVEDENLLLYASASSVGVSNFNYILLHWSVFTSTVPGAVPSQSLRATPFEDRILLYWKEPTEPNGIIIQYEVLLEKAEAKVFGAHYNYVLQ